MRPSMRRLDADDGDKRPIGGLEDKRDGGTKGGKQSEPQESSLEESSDDGHHKHFGYEVISYQGLSIADQNATSREHPKTTRKRKVFLELTAVKIVLSVDRGARASNSHFNK